MIIVGESRGELPEALKRIVSFFEKSKEFKEKLIGALTYPLILIITGFLVSLVLLLGVMPRFVTIFATAQIALPLPTRILLGVQHFLVTHGIALGILTVAAICVAVVGWSNPQGRRIYDSLALRIPLLGHLFLVIFVVRFCRTLGTLYNSGVQLMPALELSISSVGNSTMQDELVKTIYSVRDGKGIAGPLAKSKLIPPMVSNMIAVGEETGDLERVLLDISDYYEQEVEFVLRRIMSVLEPLALVCISFFVMFIAASVMLPLFRMSSTLHVYYHM
jgi:type II secretory pathway component PulF